MSTVLPELVIPRARMAKVTPVTLFTKARCPAYNALEAIGEGAPDSARPVIDEVIRDHVGIVGVQS